MKFYELHAVAGQELGLNKLMNDFYHTHQTDEYEGTVVSFHVFFCFTNPFLDPNPPLMFGQPQPGSVSIQSKLLDYLVYTHEEVFTSIKNPCSV